MTEKINYDQLLALICSVFDAYSAVLFLPDSEKKVHQISAYFSLNEFIDRNVGIEPGKGLVGWVIRDQKPLVVNNVDQYKNTLGYYLNDENATIKAFMACPLTGGLGILCVDSKRQYSFSDKDQKLLQLFTDLIINLKSGFESGMSDAREDTYYNSLRIIYDLRKKFTKWPVFLQHFLDLLVQTTGFSYAFFAARDERGEMFYIEEETSPVFLNNNKRLEVPMGSGLVGWVFKDGSPVFTETATAPLKSPLLGRGVNTPNIQSLCCLPLVINRITRGVVCLCHDQPLSITNDIKIFLYMAIDHLALFLENLYLKNKLRQAMAKFTDL